MQKETAITKSVSNIDSLIIYEIQPSDSLFSIAARIGMNEEELLDFHNANCRKKGLLLMNGLAGISKMVVPKDYKSPVQIRKELEAILPLEVVSPNFYKPTYQVCEEFIGPTEENIRIDYALDIILKDLPDDYNNSSQASVRISNFKKEGVAPDDKMSDLSIACMNTILPLKFMVPQKGQISNVADFKNLRKSFTDKRPELEDFFIGDVSKKYMDKFEENLADEIYFTKQIKSTLLYQALFPKLTWFQQPQPWREALYLVKNSFLVDCDCQVTYVHLDGEFIETMIFGEVAEITSLQQLLRGRKIKEDIDEPLNGTIQLKYTTHKMTKQLLKIEAEIVLLHDGQIYRTQKFTITPTH